MIRLGLRLTLGGGREAAARLVLIALAVAIGVGLLLTTLAGINAVKAQNAKYAWLETAYTGSNAPAVTAGPPGGPVRGDPLWWRLSADYYQDRRIGRVDVAATGPASPVPPGISALPGPGQFYASPALAELIRDTPAARLGNRFPGRQIGTVGPAALPAPNSLIIIIGHSVADLSHQDRASQVTAISTTVPSSCLGECAFGVGIDGNGMTLVLSVVTAALLFPVLVFVGGATRLSAARREQRFAAMRLVGATPRQISVISTVESSVATVIGLIAGFGLFYALRPQIAAIPFTGDPFYTRDLSLSWTNVLAIAIGLPVAAAVAARWALRRVNISPLGVSRRVTPSPPRAARLVPLLAGVGYLVYLAYVSDIGNSRKHTGPTQAYAYLSGILVVMSGLVIAGPWLTMTGSRLMARCATRPATLIAARRLADNPAAGFRAISGLVLALFVGTCSLGIITTIVVFNGGGAGARADAKSTVVDQLWEPERTSPPTSIPYRTMADLASTPGVSGVAVIHAQPEPDPKRYPPEAVACAELTGVPALGHCPAAAETVTIYPDYGGGVIDKSSMGQIIWPAATLTPAALQHLPIDTIVVGTDGSSAAVERARTVLERSGLGTLAPQTLSEIQIDNTRQLDSYRQLADVVILVSLPIAGCSLAVSVAGGVAERKRPFSLLRLTGAPLALLRRIIALETAAPLFISAVVSAGTGLLCAHLFLHAQLKETLQPPGAQYYLVVAAGLIVSLAVIASTLPLLNRLTGPDSARNE